MNLPRDIGLGGLTSRLHYPVRTRHQWLKLIDPNFAPTTSIRLDQGANLTHTNVPASKLPRPELLIGHPIPSIRESCFFCGLAVCLPYHRPDRPTLDELPVEKNLPPVLFSARHIFAPADDSANHRLVIPVEMGHRRLAPSER